MKGNSKIDGFIIGNWILLIILLISTVLLLTGSSGNIAALAPTFFLISFIWLIVRVIKYGFKYCFTVEDGNSQTTDPQDPPSSVKDICTYPMKSGAINAAIGAVDKCCEFAAFCEKYVIQGISSPEPLAGYIIATPQEIGFGFTWNTFFYSLDSAIEKQGYSIHEDGFSFSDNSGIVFYQKQIPNESPEFSPAYSYMINTPIEDIISEFERIAESNFTSMGINSHKAYCTCSRSERDSRDFRFAV